MPMTFWPQCHKQKRYKYMKKSVVPEQVLKNLNDVITVWEDNPDFAMGPEVTLKSVKSTRDKLDQCIKDSAKTDLLLTKQLDNRDDCARVGHEYIIRSRKAILGYFGLDSAEYAQVGGTRASERKTPGRKPKNKSESKAA